KLRRSSYQPLCLKMPRKKSPNPRSKPRPRAVFIKDSRKNAPDNPAQTSASEPGKPWYWARRQATAVHRPNRQGTVRAATRQTSSVIAAVLGRSKIERAPVILGTNPNAVTPTSRRRGSFLGRGKPPEACLAANWAPTADLRASWAPIHRG